MVLKTFTHKNGKIGGVPDIIVYSERKDGLYITHERKKIIERRIGGFVLRLVEENRETISEDAIQKYNFKVYRTERNRVVENKTNFYIFANERASNKKVAARLKDVVLEKDKISLEYLELYITYLINNGIKLHSHRLVDNEITVEKVKEYLTSFVQIIHGEESKFIENSYDYYKNRIFYEEKHIRGNKDLFLYNRKWKENYKKMGYEYNKYWYIHLPALITFMEEKSHCKERMTAQMLNIGLHKLGIMALPSIKNTQNVKARIVEKEESEEEIIISMNLTKIHTKELLKLAYPIEEVEPEEEKPKPIEDNDFYDEDDPDSEDVGFYNDNDTDDEEEEEKNFDDIIEELGLKSDMPMSKTLRIHFAATIGLNADEVLRELLTTPATSEDDFNFLI